jgi:hypothetical protein
MQPVQDIQIIIAQVPIKLNSISYAAKSLIRRRENLKPHHAHRNYPYCDIFEDI